MKNGKKTGLSFALINYDILTNHALRNECKGQVWRTGKHGQDGAP